MYIAKDADFGVSGFGLQGFNPNLSLDTTRSPEPKGLSETLNPSPRLQNPVAAQGSFKTNPKAAQRRRA